MTTAPPPRRNWHFTRWLIVGIIAMLGWSGWRAHTFRIALAEADALGWELSYTDPVKTVRANWKEALQKATWMDGVYSVRISWDDAFEDKLAIVDRLNPKRLAIGNNKLRDLSLIKSPSRLERLELGGCTGVTNVDAMKNFSALQALWLDRCTGLTNVDALKHLSTLRIVSLDGCTGLTKASVESLKSARPKTIITGP